MFNIRNVILKTTWIKKFVEYEGAKCHNAKAFAKEINSLPLK